MNVFKGMSFINITTTALINMLITCIHFHLLNSSSLYPSLKHWPHWSPLGLRLFSLLDRVRVCVWELDCTSESSTIHLHCKGHPLFIKKKKKDRWIAKGGVGKDIEGWGGFDGFWLGFTALNETTVECLLGWAKQHTFGSSWAESDLLSLWCSQHGPEQSSVMSTFSYHVLSCGLVDAISICSNGIISNYK